MMDNQIHQHLLWTFILNYMLVQAEIGDVYDGLRYQMYNCLCDHSSLHECLTQQTSCLRSSIFRCLRFHEPLKDYHSEIGTLCGVINTGRQLTSHTWHIIIRSEFSLHLEFVHFHLPATPHCASGTRVIVNPKDTVYMYTYCGHRMPWDISFQRSHAFVTSSTESYTPRGFHFVMIFQAFDIKFSLPTFAHWYDTPIDDYLANNTGVFTLRQYLAIGQKHRFMEQIHITVLVIYKIKIKMLSTIPMRIYDGPGILSPVILPKPNATSVIFSHYQGFVTYSTRWWSYSPSNISNHILKWYRVIVDNHNCKGYGFHKTLKGTYGKCGLSHAGILTIHQMLLFTGYNMLSHSNISIYSGCQYGGLFILGSLYQGQDEYFKLCSTITQDVIFPIPELNTLELNDEHNLIFITFQGYSSGFIDLIFSLDKTCSGENMAIVRGPSNHNFKNTWMDIDHTLPLPSLSGLRGIKITCTDVWILNNIMNVEISPIKNWSLTLDHSKLAFPVGPFTLIISTLFIIQPSFSSMNMDIPSLGYIEVEIDVFKDFPIHVTTEKVNFSVPLSTKYIATFNSSIFTAFHVSYSGSDRFPIFAIRVQFIEHVICSGQKISQQLYPTTVLIEDVFDVYLPRNYPVKKLLVHDLLYRYGYNRGTCRALIPGHKCSQSISHHEIVKIHHHPHTSLVVPHEIDISMKKAANCSVECSLDIGILEYMHGNATRISRYHEWRRIYRLTWQVIAARSRGFLVTINSTCDACTQLCDIALAIGFPLTRNHILDLTATQQRAKYVDFLQYYFQMNLPYPWDPMSYDVFVDGINNMQKSKHGVTSSDHMYGNWYDASAYCFGKKTLH